MVEKFINIKRCVEKKKMLVRHNRLPNSCLITFEKNTEPTTEGKEAVTRGVLKNFANFTEKHLC